MMAVANLQLSLPNDGLPDFIPDTLTEWLRLIRLESYIQTLMGQGYTTIHQVLSICVEDLEDIGFYKLGHQKRLLLAIKKIKDLSQRQNGRCSTRKSFSSFNSNPVDATDDTPISMPEPMQPIHNPLYLNTLVPYLDSLALPKQEENYTLKTRTFPNTFQSLPPKSKPVAKVPANFRPKTSTDNRLTTDLGQKTDYHKAVNNIDKMSRFKENSEFNRTLSYKPSKDKMKTEKEEVTYTNIPISKYIQDANKTAELKNEQLTNQENCPKNGMSKSEFIPSTKPKQMNKTARTRTR